jgi:branched-chain amino acid aminotransferase
LSMPLRDRAFDIDRAGVIMAAVAVTFEFRDNTPVGRTEATTMADASAALPEGSYTTLRTYGGNGVVRLGRHVRRLVESLPSSRRLPLDEGAVRAALGHALRETVHDESRLRVTFAPPRLFVSVEPFVPPDPVMQQTGVACMTMQIERDRPEAKDTRFLAAAHTAYSTMPAMIHEGLLVSYHGAILEGLSSNFFGILGGRLHTEDTRVLAGVTRSMVLEIAKDVLPRGEGSIHRAMVPELEEAFITSVSREVLPVVKIDGTTIGSGKPGPRTVEIARRFREAVEREVERLA